MADAENFWVGGTILQNILYNYFNFKYNIIVFKAIKIDFDIFSYSSCLQKDLGCFRNFNTAT